jgi:hypothetical protein
MGAQPARITPLMAQRTGPSILGEASLSTILMGEHDNPNDLVVTKPNQVNE